MLVSLLASAAGGGTYSAFSSTAANQGNTFAAGTVRLTDDDLGQALFTVAGAGPGWTTSRCLKVVYDGSLGAQVGLYGEVGGALAGRLRLVVTRGSMSSACSSFAPDTTDYLGRGPGVVYDGTLAAYPADHASGLTDPSTAAPAAWATGESHTYHLALSLGTDPAAQGQTATVTFTWEARNR